MPAVSSSSGCSSEKMPALPRAIIASECGQDRHHRALVCLLHAFADDGRVEADRCVVDDEGDPWHVELLGDVHRHAGALVVLLVRAKDHEQGVGDDQGQQRLLLETGMRVEEQGVQLQGVDELAEPLD